MSPVECGDGIRLTTSAGEVVSYSLHNVVVHYGDTVEGGHYYTWVRLGPDSWSRISDNLVFNQQATAENLVFQLPTSCSSRGRQIRTSSRLTKE